MAIDWTIIRVSILVVIALIYALFDVFNKREVPNIFAYASVIIAVAVALLSGSGAFMGAVTALICAGAGYLVYRAGFLGAGDVFELVAITLLLPVQPAPLLSAVVQLGMPFILSVFIAAGYASIIMVVVYYLIFTKKSPLEKGFRLERGKVLYTVLMLALYLVLILMINSLVGISAVGVILLLCLAMPSAIMLVFEKLINYRMVSLLHTSELTEGDMIAVNLMTGQDISYFRSRSKRFGRLATNGLISDLKREKKTLPVYRNAVPLAAFFLVGVVFSLLFGNLLLLIF